VRSYVTLRQYVEEHLDFTWWGKLSFIRPSKPAENAYIESFNGKFRDECLTERWSLSLRQARSLIEA